MELLNLLKTLKTLTDRLTCINTIIVFRLMVTDSHTQILEMLSHLKIYNYKSCAQPREEGHVSAHFFLVIYQDNKTVIKVFW